MRPLTHWYVLPLVFVCLIACPRRIHGQAETRLTFEAASVKPSNSASLLRRMGVPGDRFIAKNEPLISLIAVAYGLPGPLPQPLPNYKLAGGPNWINSDRFDIEAKALGDVVRGTEGTRRKQLMLQMLLADRFKLVVRHEMKEQSVYELVLARRNRALGAKLRPSKIDRAALQSNSSNPPTLRPAFGTPACEAAGGICAPGVNMSGVFKGSAVTMAELITYLSRWLDRAVFDRTGLAGAFDVELQFASEGLQGLPTGPPGMERAPNDNPSIFVAVQEQLGLKLASTKRPVDVLVIDHAEKPTPD